MCSKCSCSNQTPQRIHATTIKMPPPNFNGGPLSPGAFVSSYSLESIYDKYNAQIFHDMLNDPRITGHIVVDNAIILEVVLTGQPQVVRMWFEKFYREHLQEHWHKPHFEQKDYNTQTVRMGSMVTFDSRYSKDVAVPLKGVVSETVAPKHWYSWPWWNRNRV